jgi:propanol-preferring alcohol dehydrogenase
MKMMNVAQLHSIGKRLRLDYIKIPSIGKDEVLVDIKASGICHSDLNYCYGRSPVGKLPIVLGHEIAGIISQIGKNVENLKIGDKVCIDYIISCGNCRFCRSNRENLCEYYQMIGKDLDGGFAEYIKVPTKNVFKLPKNIQLNQAAIIGCAVSTAFHALNRAKIVQSDTVMIYGTGGVGIQAVQLASKIFKVKKIIAVDVSNKKLEIAKRLGANITVNALENDLVKKIKDFNNGQLADVVLEFIGLKKTIEKAFQFITKGGKIILVGIGPEALKMYPYKTIISKEIEIIGSNDHLKIEIEKLIKLLKAGKINLYDSITHKFSLENVNLGIDLLNRKQEDTVRSIIVQ